ncbi:MAG: phosphoribosylformylglycinamidine synthase subunit PurL [Segniliparus sp.]|uniref:phosphoribosylformylglycinamidine synthase subunit PurL n=1 Tax=Segniliparus sp. TaxID=2804064 RepID=UPI003F395177
MPGSVPTQHVDTVEIANQTPDHPQPFRELGLTEDEYERIRELLGRRPTDPELGMYSVMWSEHCSYKSSKVHLKYFGETTTEAMRAGLLAGIGANAGVVDVGQGWAVTFKAESHNHPSFIEPYQGAATGVGGIVRDILAMGARPVAVMDQLCFGEADAPDTHRVLPGVVAGVGGYGNCLGLPNIGGQTLFDACYAGNPLVNALCLGVLRADAVHEAKASGVGNLVVLYGARTGRDGIGGVSVLASETFEGESAGGGKKLPAVQVGDPFMEKLLIESSLEIFAAGLVEGIQDLGGAGLSCAISELAAAGDGGMHVTLDRVPLRAADMTPTETLCSESQERMCAIVAPDKLDEFLAICARWEVTATVIGEVTDTGRLQVDWHGERIVDVVARTLADEGPVYHRPIERPAFQDALVADSAAALARPADGAGLQEALLALLASPGLCSKRFITQQYDSLVRGNSVLIPGADAGLVRVDEESGLGVAIATDANGRYAKLDPYRGAQLALAEAYRNVAVAGAVPRAVTNCLNFGSPQDPGVMWQFAQAVRGLADGCAVLGIPVTGGNVSFYNQTADVAINPTPVVGVLGVVDDVARAVKVGFAPDHGQVLFLLGETRDELDGSAWAHVVHGHLGGEPPVVDLEAERRLAEVLHAAGRQGLPTGAHDLSEGGLAQALAESVLAAGTGVRVTLPAGADPFVSLFSESSGRALVAVTHTQAGAFEALVGSRGVPLARVGVVVPGSAELEVQGLFTVGVAELREAHEGTLPALFA